MAKVVVVHPADAAARLTVPRDDALVRERATGGDAFELAEGAFRRYRRTLRTLDDGRVQERVDFTIAVPVWGLLTVAVTKRAFARAARRAGGLERAPWWAPPERMDERAGAVFGLLLTLSLVGGYLSTLISQTLTYAADEFDVGVGAQKDVLTAVRLSVVVLVPLAALADRLGRRRLLLLTATVGCVATATGAFVPDLLGYGISQTAARGFASALLVLVAIVSAEEMPSGSRAWAYSLIAMTQALGAGLCVLALPLVDLDIRAWRGFYLFPLLFLPLVVAVGRVLPESRRFEAPHAAADATGHGRRFWLLAVTGFLLAVFATPFSQLSNEFLNEVRGFSAARISLFTVLTVTPGALGIVIGGRLADERGRRVVGAIGLLGGTAMSVVLFMVTGWTMWGASTLSSVVGGAVVPALGVYKPELFPTSLRGKAGGLLEGIQVAGSVVGIQLVGSIVDGGGSYGSAFALAAIGPVIVAVLLLTVFPETAHQSLEDLNPEDRERAGP